VPEEPRPADLQDSIFCHVLCLSPVTGHSPLLLSLWPRHGLSAVDHFGGSASAYRIAGQNPAAQKRCSGYQLEGEENLPHLPLISFSLLLP